MSGIVVLTLLLLHSICAQSGIESLRADSLAPKTSIEGFFATSLIYNRNWEETDNSSILFNLNLKVRSSSTLSAKRIIDLYVDLAYLKFIDSVWIKNTDRILFSTIWIIERRKLKQTLSINFSSQLTDTWLEKRKGNIIERKWKSGPLLPASILTGYGFIYKPFDKSFINLSFPAYKIGSLPTGNFLQDELKIIGQNNKYFLYNEFGISLRANIEKELGRRISVQSNSILLITQSGERRVYLDMVNSLSWHPLRILKLRFENRILYDETFSMRLQWRYDLLFGISLSQH